MRPPAAPCSNLRPPDGCPAAIRASSACSQAVLFSQEGVRSIMVLKGGRGRVSETTLGDSDTGPALPKRVPRRRALHSPCRACARARAPLLRECVASVAHGSRHAEPPPLASPSEHAPVANLQASRAILQTTPPLVVQAGQVRAVLDAICCGPGGARCKQRSQQRGDKRARPRHDAFPARGARSGCGGRSAPPAARCPR